MKLEKNNLVVSGKTETIGECGVPRRPSGGVKR